MYALINLIFALLRPLITPVKTNPNLLTNIEQDGALVPGGAVIVALQAMATNAGPTFGNWSQALIPASLAAATLTGNQMVGGIVKRFSPGVAFTDCTDTATNIILAIPGAVVNQSFPLLIGNLGSGLETIGAGTGVTIVGSATISSNSVRLFLGTVTGSAAVTLTSCFQFGGSASQGPL